MRRIAVVITARASYARIRSVLLAMRDDPDFLPLVIVAGSALLDRYGDIRPFIEGDGLHVVRSVPMVVEGGTPAEMVTTTGLGMIRLASVLEDLHPDAVITIADRYETLATATAAAYMNIPLIHLQGGEVTGSIDDKVRNAITQLADTHLVATDRAYDRVWKMRHDGVHKVGCPSIDLARWVRLNAGDRSFDPIERYGGVGADIDFQFDDYIVVLQHPVTTEYGRAGRDTTETLGAVHAMGGVHVAWIWPNVDAGTDGTSNAIRHWREREGTKNIRFFKNMAPVDFLTFLLGSRCLVGNSSVGIRECSYLGVPVVNIGTRQNGRERGPNVVDVPANHRDITAAIKAQMSDDEVPCSTLYGDGYAAERILDVLRKEPEDDMVFKEVVV